MDKPAFDPSQPFHVGDKPPFDPSKPFDAAPSVGLGEDIAKGAGAGLASAAIGTLGSVGDIRDLASRGVDAIAPKLGIDPATVKGAANAASYALPGGRLVAGAPNSKDIASTVTDPIVSPDYQPQTFAGKVTKTGAEFLPAAMVGGPEGIAAKFATRVAVPALASETAGALTNDNPYAKIGAALLGGVGASKIGNVFNESMLASKVPTAENLLKTAGQQFEDVKSSNLIVKPAAIEQIAKDIKTELLNDGYHPTISAGQNGVFNTLDRLERLGTSGGGVTPKDLEVIRKNLVASKMDVDPATRQLAKQATDTFMQKYTGLGRGDVLNGDAAATTATLKDAIGNYAAGKRSNTVTGKVDLANLNAGTAGSGANIDNNMRQAIKQLARPVNNTNMPVAKKLGFSDQEIEAIKQAATGTAVGNTARYLGKYAPTGIVSAAGGAGLGHLVGGPAGAAIPVVGYIAKKIGDLSTKRAVNALDSLVRSRSPLANQVAGQLAPQIVNQLPAKSQRILQTMAVPAAPTSQSAPPPQAAPIQAPFRPILPQQAAPIFPSQKTEASPLKPAAPLPPIIAGPTAAADGQPSRPSRVGLGDNIRLGKYQNWDPGRIVKVGFVDGLKVEGTVAPYAGEPSVFILTKGDNVYRVTPHQGMEKLTASDGAQLLKDARQNSR